MFAELFLLLCSELQWLNKNVCPVKKEGDESQVFMKICGLAPERIEYLEARDRLLFGSHETSPII